MKLSIVAAMSENRVIGRGSEIPWRVADDQKAVRALTMGHCLIMGRKTWDTIGRPLPGRISIVLTRDPGFAAAHDDVLVAHDFEAALALARQRGDDEAFAFGGEDVYAMALERADAIHLTTVHAEVEGDAFFPEFDESAWHLVSETRHEADARNEYAFTTRHYERAREPGRGPPGPRRASAREPDPQPGSEDDHAHRGGGRRAYEHGSRRGVLGVADLRVPLGDRGVRQGLQSGVEGLGCPHQADHDGDRAPLERRDAKQDCERQGGHRRRGVDPRVVLPPQHHPETPAGVDEAARPGANAEFGRFGRFLHGPECTLAARMRKRRIRIDLAAQRLDLCHDRAVVRSYPVSTARRGAGEREGSECTPRGLHRVEEKIGAGAAPGSVFVGRQPTGEVCTPAAFAAAPERDWILTRILWLGGCEPGRNQGGSVDTRARFVYIHGCPDELPLGVPGSHGCIRMRNSDVIDLFDRVEVGTEVEIREQLPADAGG